MFRTKRIFTLALIIVITCITTIFVVNAVGQQQVESVTGDNVKSVLFMDANGALKAAEKVHADVLAPKNFGEAMKRYQEAEADLQQGKKLEDIQTKLHEACVFFQGAIDATKLAAVTFPNSMKARMDAQNTESARFSVKFWTEAEKKFNEAAGILEDGDVKEARNKAGEAEKLYRQAELDAIKTNYLHETHELLKQADKLKVKNYAPKILLSAQQLIKQAEKELNENRYDTDVARSLAQQAKYQAKHAIYLATTINQMKKKNQSMEDIILNSEKPLQQIAEKADLVTSFETGTGKTTDAIIAYISTYQNRVAGLSQDLEWNHQESELQEARITELEQQLGSQAQEKSVLARQLAKQAKTREQFATMERSFLREEASVSREGNDIIIRLIGLNFPSAAATIEQQSFGLLTKVRNAINSFPECTISVQGYTDSYGGDEQNLQLSKARAEAVAQYILANTKLDASRVDATAFGESKPIASNDTAEGRAANRRVEVVIHSAPVELIIGSK